MSIRDLIPIPKKNKMTKFTKFFSCLFLLSMFLTVNARPVSACSCIVNLSLVSQLASATAIFSGIATNIKALSTPNADDLYRNEVTMDVQQIWKGPNSQTLTLTTGGTTCDYGFEVGKAYLVFAIEFKGRLSTNICTLTQPLRSAEKTLDAFDRIYSWPFLKVQTPATITVNGYSHNIMNADLVNVRFVFAKEQESKAVREVERQRLTDAFQSAGAANTLLVSLPFNVDREGIYFAAKLESFSNGDPTEYLQLLDKIHKTLTTTPGGAFARVEVMFTLQDCTMMLVWAQRNALSNAGTTGELLATHLGSKIGKIVAITNLSNDTLLKEGAEICGDPQPRPWYRLPIKTDLETAMQISTEITLSVTFQVEEAVPGAQTLPAHPKQTQATPTLSTTSPLLTPTPP